MKFTFFIKFKAEMSTFKRGVGKLGWIRIRDTREKGSTNAIIDYVAIFLH